MNAADVLTAWNWNNTPSLQPIDSGLINQTFLVRVDGVARAVLQCLNTGIFVPEVHEDIEAVTARLAARGLPTPRLIRPRTGGLWVTAEDDSVWRCLTHLGDRTVDVLADPADARSAGALIARFHTAIRDLDWRFRSVRPGAQDTEKHLANLRSAITEHRDHRLYDAVAPLADTVFDAWDDWSGPSTLPTRVIHGDLKISNLRFEGPEALALIDLDTLARGTLETELGDAMRSWCNPAREDATAAAFDLDLFEAAMRGYAEGAAEDGPTDDEWAAILPGIERITLNLVARFAADALQESYFGWDARFGGRGEHNLVRARGQASLLDQVRAARGKAEARLERARRG